MERKWANQLGIMLMEILIVLSVFVLAMISVINFSSQQSKLIEVSGTGSDIRTELQLASARIADDLRHGTRTRVATPPNASIEEDSYESITFYRPYDADGNSVIIDKEGNVEWNYDSPINYWYDKEAQQIKRDEGDQSVVIANNVTNVMFTDKTLDSSLRINEIRITLTLEKTLSFGQVHTETMTTLVTLRN